MSQEKIEEDENALYLNTIAHQWTHYEKGYVDIAENIRRLKELGSKDATRFETAINYWNYLDNNFTVNMGIAPDGIDDNTIKKTVIVVLGYGLNPDGSMKDELVNRLIVAKLSYEKYKQVPYILCTGGGTASQAPDKTEGGQMAKWLKENGVNETKIIVEDKSKDTVQNAQYSLKILNSSYPDLNNIILVTSDYHIKRGCLLFHTYYLYHQSEFPNYNMKIISNAAWEKGVAVITDSEQYMKAISFGTISGHAIPGSYTSKSLSKIQSIFAEGKTYIEYTDKPDFTVKAVYKRYDGTTFNRDITKLAKINGWSSEVIGPKTLTISYFEEKDYIIYVDVVCTK